MVSEPAKGELTLLNPRPAALTVSHTGLESGASTSFSLSLRNPAGPGEVPLPSPAAPLTVPGYGRVTLAVAFAPTTVGQETTAVEIVTDATPSPVTVRVFGNALKELCPTAIISAAENLKVTKGTTIQLNGLNSGAWDASVTTWKWDVTPPPGTKKPAFMPSASVATPSVTIEEFGTYEVHLTVKDTFGVASCTPATAKVECISDNDLDVRLMWETAGDPDTSDATGSNLNLHLVHDQLAPWYDDVDGDGQPDPWFSPDYDCFWYHPKPAWGSFDPTVDDDPQLDHDDTDGLGPETISLFLAEKGTGYRVGVENQGNPGFGPSKAVITITVKGVVVYEVSQLLDEGCLWDVATLAWPSGAVTPTKAPNGIGPRVTCPYVNKLFDP